MNTMITTERLAEVEKLRSKIIKRAEEQMAEALETAKKDFTAFFHWRAEATYQSQLLLDFFTQMPRVTEGDDIEALKATLARRIENIERDILECNPLGSCTNEIVNLEHRLKIIGKQVIRRQLQEMQWILEA